MKARYQGLHQKPEKFLDEDYSDLFGHAVEREMAAKELPKNLFCFMRPGPKDKPDPDYSTMIQPLEDPHSSALFRLISNAAERNKLTPNCRRVHRESGSKANLEACWPKT